MNCNICNSKTFEIFKLTLLEKYNVSYFQCENCKFIQTEFPYWLNEAYSDDAIGALDVGIVSRNILLKDKTNIFLLKLNININSFRGLDYGGGHGLFVRMMRDMGYNFYRQDLYAKNLYSRYFDIKDLPSHTVFNLLTAFEVFEHLVDPISDIKKMLSYSDIILFSTVIQPFQDIEKLKEWWYFVPKGGQHISIFHMKTFEYLKKELKLHFYSNGNDLHVLTKKELPFNPFINNVKKSNCSKNILQKVISKLDRTLNKESNSGSVRSRDNCSLIQSDFEFVKNKISCCEN